MDTDRAFAGPVAVLFSLAGLLAFAASAIAESIDSIPDPRPERYAVDLTGTFSAETLEALDRLGAETRTRTTGEVVVVVIRTTGGRNARAFATDLFNRWRIGDPEKNNGILLLVALEDRAAEIVLGDGVDSDAEVRESDRIMAEEVVARFKAGDPAGGVFCGAMALAERILGAEPGAAHGDLESAGTAPSRTAPPPRRPPAPRPSAPPAPAARPAALEHDSGLGTFGWVGIGGGGAGILGIALRAWLRRRPRKCPGCGRKMVRLSETADDEHLAGPERVEEKLGSVDYDIWHCEPCNRVLKLRYGAFFTSYGKCPECGYRTKSSSSTTIRAATYASGGLVRVNEDCRNCSFNRTYTRSTPKLTPPSKSSSRSSGFRSSSSRSSGSRGGSSSGRGSSGRW